MHLELCGLRRQPLQGLFVPLGIYAFRIDPTSGLECFNQIQNSVVRRKSHAREQSVFRVRCSLFSNTAIFLHVFRCRCILHLSMRLRDTSLDSILWASDAIEGINKNLFPSPKGFLDSEHFANFATYPKTSSLLSYSTSRPSQIQYHNKNALSSLLLYGIACRWLCRGIRCPPHWRCRRRRLEGGQPHWGRPRTDPWRRHVGEPSRTHPIPTAKPSNKTSIEPLFFNSLGVYVCVCVYPQAENSMYGGKIRTRQAWNFWLHTCSL